MFSSENQYFYQDVFIAKLRVNDYLGMSDMYAFRSGLLNCRIFFRVVSANTEYMCFTFFSWFFIKSPDFFY